MALDRSARVRQDGAADTVIPRLKALGADMDRVFIWRQGNALGTAGPTCAQ